MSDKNAEKIVANFKGLRSHMQEGEQPVMTIPAIWDDGETSGSTGCDVILTNQRLIGYYYVSFPRERVFFKTLDVKQITAISVLKKTFNPLFEELLVREGEKRKVYIRAPRRKIEELYRALRTTRGTTIGKEGEEVKEAVPIPDYERQKVRVPFENSPLAITLLFVGGLCLELVGGYFVMTQNVQIGWPLCLAGFVAVFFAMFVKRQRSQQ